MVERKFKKWQLAFIVGLIFIIPMIILFQYTKADIVINIDDDFKNQCFFGQTECVYDKRINITFEDSQRIPIIQFRETVNNWQIIGDNVWCIQGRSVAIPVTNPQQEITKDSEVSCNNIAVFDRDEWDLQIQFLVPNSLGELERPFPLFSSAPPPPEGSINRFIFTMKGI